jgi:Coenzyme PQQ synthesis protein D (PqqD)
MYALNDLAAFIWCQLEERRTPNEICADLIAGGISRNSAREYVYEAVRAWLRNGILRLEHSTSCFGVSEYPLAIRVETQLVTLHKLLGVEIPLRFRKRVMPRFQCWRRLLQQTHAPSYGSFRF